MPHWDGCEETHLLIPALTVIPSLLPSEVLTSGFPRGPGLQTAKLYGVKVLGLESFLTFHLWALE